MLDAYAQGRFDEALVHVQRARRDRTRSLRRQLVDGGGPWVDLVPAERPRRALAAATFALEVERIRAERGEWNSSEETDCAGRCVIEWACSLLQGRGAPDDGERIWMQASIALVEGLRDWPFLQTPLAPRSSQVVERGHVHHALARFPDEARFHLARAVALSSRHAITTELDMPREGGDTAPSASRVIDLASRPGLVALLEQRQSGTFEYAKDALEALVSDVKVGDEARIRLGYMHFVRGDVEKALAIERAVAAVTGNADLKYVANFIAAQAAQALGDLAAAEGHYRAALDARPHSQSATLGLAALIYQRGEGSQAYAMVEASRTERPRDDDPWRLFLYGDFPKLPELIRELRRRVSP
jgi:tetratricopeptide (TPR) repeat protein